MSPIQSSGSIPNFLLQFFGGDAEQDAMDWRYYWAALDANLDGQRTVAFDLGTWSDGVSVAAPSVACGRHEYRVAAANSVGEGSRSPVSVAVVPCRPDLEVAASRTSPFVGDGIYLAQPAGSQLRSASVAARATAAFPVRVGNDGEVAASFRVQAALSGAPTGFGVTIRRDGQDVTAAVLAGTYVVTDLAPRWRRRRWPSRSSG